MAWLWWVVLTHTLVGQGKVSGVGRHAASKSTVYKWSAKTYLSILYLIGHKDLWKTQKHKNKKHKTPP